MKLLVIADEESPLFWEYFRPERVEDIDLILACGDLDAAYLSFLATCCRAPVVYVPGNHDTGYQKKPPEGCLCADGRLVVCKGLRILGLGGCMNYNGGFYQYTEGEMRRRVRRLTYPLWKQGGFDILLTHAPAWGCGDGADLAHKGFAVFNDLMDKYRPPLMVHGHLHQRYDPNFRRERRHGDTRVVNGCGWVILEQRFQGKADNRPASRRPPEHSG